MAVLILINFLLQQLFKGIKKNVLRGYIFETYAHHGIQPTELNLAK